MKRMPELNAAATEFIPQYIKEEKEVFDRLEQDFIEQNKWLFLG
jgi:hypothetical protein